MDQNLSFKLMKLEPQKGSSWTVSSRRPLEERRPDNSSDTPILPPSFSETKFCKNFTHEDIISEK